MAYSQCARQRDAMLHYTPLCHLRVRLQLHEFASHRLVIYSLYIATFSNLLFLKTVGPPLENFQPLKYVKSWLAKGHHAATDFNSMTHLDTKKTAADMSAIWKYL